MAAIDRFTDRNDVDLRWLAARRRWEWYVARLRAEGFGNRRLMAGFHAASRRSDEARAQREAFYDSCGQTIAGTSSTRHPSV